MSEMKTVARRIRPVKIRCGVHGCPSGLHDAALEEGATAEGDAPSVIAPKGWTFAAKHPESTHDVIVGTCPVHSARR